MFGKKDKDKEKDKKLTGQTIRIRINRLVNNSPTEVAVFNAEFIRDKYNNSVIVNDDKNFKEEFPGVTDALVSDILYKLESRNLTHEEQIKKVKKAINNQEEILRDEKKGFIHKTVDGVEKEFKINVQTEKMKLRLLKCVKYTLENKKGEGFYESVEIDGSRSLTYVLIDGEIIPYWAKTPTVDGEPVFLVPDVSLRKKFYKEASDEAFQDFRDGMDTKFQSIMKTIALALIVIVAMGNIGWTVYNARWSSDLRDESLQPELDKLAVDIQKAKQDCISQLVTQVESNNALIDYARMKIDQETKQSTTTSGDTNMVGNKVNI